MSSAELKISIERIMLFDFFTALKFSHKVNVQLFGRLKGRSLLEASNSKMI